MHRISLLLISNDHVSNRSYNITEPTGAKLNAEYHHLRWSRTSPAAGKIITIM